MQKLFLSLLIALYVTFGLSGCKSFVTSAPEQWVSKVGEAIVLIEDTKGLIELAKELGMDWITLVKQKNGTYAPKDHTEKLKDSKASTGVDPSTSLRVTEPQGIMSTSLSPGTDPNEIRVPITSIIRRTRVVH